MLGLFARGVFLNPMGTKLYLSLAHDEAASANSPVKPRTVPEIFSTVPPCRP